MLAVRSRSRRGGLSRGAPEFVEAARRCPVPVYREDDGVWGSEGEGAAVCD